MARQLPPTLAPTMVSLDVLTCVSSLGFQARDFGGRRARQLAGHVGRFTSKRQRSLSPLPSSSLVPPELFHYVNCCYVLLGLRLLAVDRFFCNCFYQKLFEIFESSTSQNLANVNRRQEDRHEEVCRACHGCHHSYSFNFTVLASLQLLQGPKSSVQ